MKTTTLHIVAFLSLILFFSNCREEAPGPRGPQGPQGPQGLNGLDAPLPLEYEFGFDLTDANNWTVYYTFPANDEIYSTDVVLVYLLWDVIDNADGTTTDVWKPLPVTYFSNAGQEIIEFNHTVDDVSINLYTSYDNEVVRTEMTDLIARVVIIPAEPSANATARKAHIDYSDYEAVKAAYGLKGGERTHQGNSFKDLVRK